MTLLHPVARAAQLAMDLLHPVARAAQLAMDLLHPVARAAQFAMALLHPVVKAAQFAMDLLHPVARAAQFAMALLHPVAKAATPNDHPSFRKSASLLHVRRSQRKNKGTTCCALPSIFPSRGNSRNTLRPFDSSISFASNGSQRIRVFAQTHPSLPHGLPSSAEA